MNTSPLCFYGYEQRTNVSRLFKIYATPQGLFFGWIADRDHEEMLARFAGTGTGQTQTVAAAKTPRRSPRSGKTITRR